MSDPEIEVLDLPSNWHSVTCGDWSVTVGPDGNIRLPQLVRLEDVDSFIRAINAAKPVAEKQVADNKAAAAAPAADRVQRMAAADNLIRRTPRSVVRTSTESNP